jgi:hypothetical protein
MSRRPGRFVLLPKNLVTGVPRARQVVKYSLRGATYERDIDFARHLHAQPSAAAEHLFDLHRGSEHFHTLGIDRRR